MDYYSKKTKAFDFIDQLVSEGTDQDDIAFRVETAFGFNEKFTLDRIEKLNKQVKKANWINEKKKKEIEKSQEFDKLTDELGVKNIEKQDDPIHCKVRD